MKRILYLFVMVTLFLSSSFAQYNDPAAYDVIKAPGTITVDGNINEAAWGLVPNVLMFGPNAPVNTTTLSVTNGVMVKLDSLKGYDTTYTTLKMIKQGLKLYIAFSSTDKQVCRFGDSWEGDGLFMKIKNSAGQDKEFKLYFNAAGVNPDIVLETPGAGYGSGAAVKGSNTIVNDTTQTDNGYSAELVINLDQLGYTVDTKSVQVMINIFDPDYYHNGMQPWGARGSYHKTWWGSEWGPVFRTINFKDDPDQLTVLSTPALTVDGNLNEASWNLNFEHLLFGPGAVGTTFGKTVTGGVLVKNPFNDTTITTVKILHSGLKLYFGFYSNDKSVCRFGDSWEGDGMFMKVKTAAGQEKEFKLYFNQAGINSNVNFEASVPGSGMGAAVKGSNTIVNDTTQIDNGYTAELVVYLDSLGYTNPTATVPVMINIFDPDGYHNGMAPWGTLGGYHKTWWGSEWGSSYRNLVLSPVFVPVELTSFTAASVSNGIELTWSTASEKNNRIFEIERKDASTQFTSIGFVNGKGTTSENNTYKFVDQNVKTGEAYSYRLKQIDYDGTVNYSDVVNVNSVLPFEYALSQNYPNPFNPTSKVEFSLPVKSNISLQVYNLLGQVVMTLANGEFEAGVHSFNINASNLSSGVYMYTLNAKDQNGNSFSSSKKMVVLK